LHHYGERTRYRWKVEYVCPTPPLLLESLQINKYMCIKIKLVVITGGSQGMGKSVAMLLSKKGANIAIIARNQEKLDAALLEIAATASNPEKQRFLAVSADMTSSADTAAALERIASHFSRTPDIVWQCAGGTQPGYFRDYTGDQLEKEVGMNYFTALHTAHAAVRMMTADDVSPSKLPKGQKRHIVLTSSVLAFYAIAGYNSYSPAKAAIRALADGLRQECLLYGGIDVHACFPATIYTPGYEEEQKTKPELTKVLEGSADDGQTADEVAKACVSGLEKGEKLIVTGLLGQAMRAGSWGGTPKGNLAWDTVLAWVVAIVWTIVGRVMDWEVVKYRRKLAKERRNASST
jgi:3-dehydrosphinganine reductase